MKISCYTIYDVKAEHNHIPEYHQNDATAQRAFHDRVNHEDHPFNIHPEDYSLWFVGTFDQVERESVPGPNKLLAEGIHEMDPE